MWKVKEDMEGIIIAIITSVLSLIGVITTNLVGNNKIEQQIVTSQAVTDTKLTQLTEEVKRHNTFGDRITKLEVRVENLEKSERR